MPPGSPHRRVGSTKRRAGPDDAGFSLIEVLVSLSVIGIVLTAVTTFFVGSMATISEQSGYHTASQLATKQMETVRATTEVTALTGGTTTTQLNGIAYDITWDVRRCWQRAEVAGSGCTFSDTRPNPTTARWADLVQVGVAVSWPDKNCVDRCSYRTATLISRGELEPMFNTAGTP